MLRAEKTRYHTNGRNTYHIVVFEVPWWRYVAGRIYHVYDMRIPTKVPGWGKLEGFLQRHGAEILLGFTDEPEPRWRDRLRSWAYGQDLRCHHLNYQVRNSLGMVEIDEETYNRL